MESSLHSIAAWTFIGECSIPQDALDLMVPGEEPIIEYKTFRDAAIFTTKRLIVRDSQGLSGKKVEMYSLPYSSINMWSSENARGLFDTNAELELWTRAGHIKIKVGRGTDIRKLDRLIGACVLETQ